MALLFDQKNPYSNLRAGEYMQTCYKVNGDFIISLIGGISDYFVTML